MEAALDALLVLKAIDTAAQHRGCELLERIVARQRLFHRTATAASTSHSCA
jgi:hypothetical protein